MILPSGFVVRTPDGNQYSVKGLLGRGGFGAVYLVSEKHAPQNLFALKEITNPDQKERERFLFEGGVLKRLQHPALPRVYQVFDNSRLKRVYILMDFISGQNLEHIRQLQPEKRFPLATTLSLLKSTKEALSYIHRQHPPIIHRDIKPSNIIVSQCMERTILVDFGIAKEYGKNATTTAMRHGSPGYASPEHYSSGTNVRTDIYGLGATIYTLLSGVVPPDAIIRATSRRHHDPLIPLNKVDPTISLYVAQTIQRSMAISSEDRFSSVEEFWRHLTYPAPAGSPGRMRVMQHAQVSLADITTVKEVSQITTLSLHKTEPNKHQRTLYPRVLLLLLLLICATIPVDVGLARAYLTHKTHPISSHPSQIAAVYPLLASTYAGTIADPYHEDVGKTLYLKKIQQQQQHISGSFEGLGIVNTFYGTITPKGQVTFTVQYPDGMEILSFEGDINLGGGIGGNYSIFNNNNQSTGLHGVWQVQP